ncbi:sugar phosphate isomerase/epimerase family protein [Saccharothrix longispora]|uniref:sugar phosphate isomerase/epimerase family protein n=1 Tax=Saccharothrix longispora TaxID=33920 RepID=UPI0028FD4777|nr:sugar phosphate isomerase/epimerase family protein [Saccharothrix longispora]MDU0289912.1 sugar phosphate isomerase/epimerase family protein [Saccharothrix longispora]
MWDIGVSTWVWASPLTDDVLARLAPRIRDWGFDVVELPVEHPGDWDPHRAADLLANLGLGAAVCLVMPPGRDLLAADAVAGTQDYLRHVVDVAAVVGSGVVAGPAYSPVGRTWRVGNRLEVYAELRENLAPVVEHAASKGVRLAVEPLNRYETSLLNTVEQALEALDGLPDEGCGLALDTYHMNIEESSPAEAVRAAGARIAHVQVCANDRGTPGEDHQDWPALLRALADAGYRGPLCIESFTPDNAAIATAASIWRPLAASPDALATGGLAFLRAAGAPFRW